MEEGIVEEGIVEEGIIDDEFDDDEFDESEEELFDPLSGYNSVMTEFNDGFYVYVLDPVSRGYRFVLPEVARRGVNRFFHNLFFPIRFVNNVLQLKLMNYILMKQKPMFEV